MRPSPTFRTVLLSSTNNAQSNYRVPKICLSLRSGFWSGEWYKTHMTAFRLLMFVGKSEVEELIRANLCCSAFATTRTLSQAPAIIGWENLQHCGQIVRGNWSWCIYIHLYSNCLDLDAHGTLVCPYGNVLDNVIVSAQLSLLAAFLPRYPRMFERKAGRVEIRD